MDIFVNNKADESRRQFLKKLSASGIVLSGASLGLPGCSSMQSAPKLHKAYAPPSEESRVSVVKGSDRRQMITDSILPFKDELASAVRGKKVMIKINCNRPDEQIIKTHPDALRGILDVLTPIYSGQILIGESTALEVPTKETFSHYGYYQLEKEYNVKFVELNDNPITYHWILNRDMLPTQVGVLNPFLDPDMFIISATPLKTHGSVIVTLALKNIVMGAPLKNPKRGVNFKAPMHGRGTPGTPNFSSGPKIINYNIFQLAHVARPDFSVLDGFVGAEGDGPNDCEPVDHKVSCAGFDVISTDRIGSELMGVEWETLGYLQWCDMAGLGQGDRDKIKIIGPEPKELAIPYKLHKNIDRLLQWDEPIDWSLIHQNKS